MREQMAREKARMEAKLLEEQAALEQKLAEEARRQADKEAEMNKKLESSKVYSRVEWFWREIKEFHFPCCAKLL